MKKIMSNLYIEIFKHAFAIGSGLAAAGAVVYGTVKVVKIGATKVALAHLENKAKENKDGPTIDVSGDASDE